MENTKRLFISILIIALFCSLMISCASSRSGKVYSRDTARQVHTVKLGTVEVVRNVQIEGTKTPAGTIAGAAVGGVLGNAVGSGSGRTIATVVGALAGSMAGAAAEEGITKKDALEITVRMDSGETIVVVQEADMEVMAGDRVRVLAGPDGSMRVSN